MSERVIDLSIAAALPPRFAVDANVLITRLIPPRLVTPEHFLRFRRVRAFIDDSMKAGARGFVTPTVLNEFLHAAIRSQYLLDVDAYRHEIGGKRSWELLFKAKPDLLMGYESRIREMVEAISYLRMTVVQPGLLGPLPGGRPLEEELLRYILRYRLDSNDAAILLEMRRAGISSIVTEDPDLRRAAGDFNVYTWL